jgi:hypothetical protein
MPNKITYYSNCKDLNSIVNPIIDNNVYMQYNGYFNELNKINNQFLHGLKKTKSSQGRIFTNDASKLFSFSQGYIGIILTLPDNVYNGVYSKLLNDNSKVNEYFIWGVNANEKSEKMPCIKASFTKNGIEFLIWTRYGKFKLIDDISNLNAETPCLYEFMWDSEILSQNYIENNYYVTTAMRINNEFTVVGDLPIYNEEMSNLKFNLLDNDISFYNLECDLNQVIISLETLEDIKEEYESSSGSSSSSSSFSSSSSSFSSESTFSSFSTMSMSSVTITSSSFSTYSSESSATISESSSGGFSSESSSGGIPSESSQSESSQSESSNSCPDFANGNNGLYCVEGVISEYHTTWIGNFMQPPILVNTYGPGCVEPPFELTGEPKIIPGSGTCPGTYTTVHYSGTGDGPYVTLQECLDACESSSGSGSSMDSGSARVFLINESYLINDYDIPEEKKGWYGMFNRHVLVENVEFNTKEIYSDPVMTLEYFTKFTPKVNNIWQECGFIDDEKISIIHEGFIGPFETLEDCFKASEEYINNKNIDAIPFIKEEKFHDFNLDEDYIEGEI